LDPCSIHSRPDTVRSRRYSAAVVVAECVTVPPA